MPLTTTPRAPRVSDDIKADMDAELRKVIASVVKVVLYNGPMPSDADEPPAPACVVMAELRRVPNAQANVFSSIPERPYAQGTVDWARMLDAGGATVMDFYHLREDGEPFIDELEPVLLISSRVVHPGADVTVEIPQLTLVNSQRPRAAEVGSVGQEPEDWGHADCDVCDHAAWSATPPTGPDFYWVHTQRLDVRTVDLVRVDDELEVHLVKAGKRLPREVLFAEPVFLAWTPARLVPPPLPEAP